LEKARYGCKAKPKRWKVREYWGFEPNLTNSKLGWYGHVFTLCSDYGGVLREGQINDFGFSVNQFNDVIVSLKLGYM